MRSSSGADTTYSGSYPAAVKQFLHPLGVKAERHSATAAQRSSTVRAAAFRRRALSFEKANSIGLKSGE